MIDLVLYVLGIIIVVGVATWNYRTLARNRDALQKKYDTMVKTYTTALQKESESQKLILQLRTEINQHATELQSVKDAYHSLKSTNRRSVGPSDKPAPQIFSEKTTALTKEIQELKAALTTSQKETNRVAQELKASITTQHHVDRTWRESFIRLRNETEQQNVKHITIIRALEDALVVLTRKLNELPVEENS
eukprot:PhF_6_TR42425/c0_g1_i1/m.63987